MFIIHNFLKLKFHFFLSSTSIAKTITFTKHIFDCISERRYARVTVPDIWYCMYIVVCYERSAGGDKEQRSEWYVTTANKQSRRQQRLRRENCPNRDGQTMNLRRTFKMTRGFFLFLCVSRYNIEKYPSQYRRRLTRIFRIYYTTRESVNI